MVLIFMDQRQVKQNIAQGQKLSEYCFSLSDHSDEQHLKPGAQEVALAKLRLRNIKAMMRIVAGSVNFPIRIGEPGAGSYYAFSEGITLDPLQLIYSKEEARYVAAHECAHFSLSRSPRSKFISKKLAKHGINQERITEELGFKSLWNGLEDLAVNNWLGSVFPNLKEDLLITTSRFLSIDNPRVRTPELDAIIEQLGFYPRFGEFISEMIRKWHNGQIHPSCSPEVVKAINDCWEAIDLITNSVPRRAYPGAERVDEYFLKRFQLAVNEVWPVYKELVGLDKKKANLTASSKKALKSDPESTGQELEQKSGDGSRTETSDADVDKDSSQNLKNENTDDIPSASEKNGKDETSANTETTSESDDAGDTTSASENNSKERTAASTRTPSDISEEANRKLSEIDEVLSRSFSLAENTESSDETKAEKALQDEEVQDTKLPKPQELSSKEKRKEIKALAEQIEAQRMSKLGSWRRAKENVDHLISAFYSQLRPLFMPNQPHWDSGKSSGQRIDLNRVMQSEADKAQLSKIFMRKELPREKDYAFSLLVDRSGSMQGHKALAVLDAAVLLVETYSRLKLPIAVSSFCDTTQHLKQHDERISRALEDKLAKAILESMGNTNDALAIEECAEEIAKRPEKQKYLIIITDGESSNPGELKKILKDIRQHSQIKVIAFGIGPETSQVNEVYPNGFGRLSLSSEDPRQDFKAVFATEVRKLLISPDQYS